MRCPRCGRTLPGGMQLCCYCRYDLRVPRTQLAPIKPRKSEDETRSADTGAQKKAIEVDLFAIDPGMRTASGGCASAPEARRNAPRQSERAVELETACAVYGNALASEEPSNQIKSHVVIRPADSKAAEVSLAAAGLSDLVEKGEVSDVVESRANTTTTGATKASTTLIFAKLLRVVGVALFVVAVGLYIQEFVGKPEKAAEESPGSTVDSSASSDVYVRSPYETGADEYVLPYSDSYYYSTEDLSTLDAFGLYVARNEIFARHGFIFGRDDLKEYFSSKSWYVPTYTPEEYETLQSPTNDVENQNVQTILALEQSIGSPYI